jgi:hypothetical protein
MTDTSAARRAARAEFTSTGVVYGVADPAVTDLPSGGRVGVT